MTRHFETTNEQPEAALPGTQYIFRDPNGDNPPPPLWDELQPLAEQETREVVPADRIRFYSALVQAAMAGDIGLIRPDSGITPNPSTVRKHAGMALAVLVSPQVFRRLYDEVVTTDFVNQAVRRADEIIPYVTPASRRRPVRDTNAYDRFMALYSVLAEANGEIAPTHYAWADVRDYYQEPMAHSVAGVEVIQNTGWGTCHVKDLGEYPYFGGGEAKREDRLMFEHRFLDLDGIPQLDNLDDLPAILDELPAGTPTLCFVENMKAIMLRTGREIGPEDLEVVEFNKESVLALNLLMLHNLRSGRSISASWIKKTSGYTTAKVERAITTLLNQTAGVVTRSGRSRRQQLGDPHYDIPDRAFILDARQKVDIDIADEK